MNRRFGVLVLLLSAFVLNGCLDVETVVKVSPDGSGTIEETVIMSGPMIEMMRSMGNMMSEQAEGLEQEQFDLFDEEELKEKASEKGEGVGYLSGKKVKTEKGEGYEVVYSFTDINKIRVDQNVSDKVPSGPGQKKSSAKKEEVAFEFSKGSPAVLRVKLPAKEMDEPERTEEGSKQDVPESMEGQDEMAMEQMKKMFQGMRVSMSVEVQGEITETNATYREGSKVTLIAMDFDMLMQDAAKFKEFSKLNPQSVEEAKEIMKEIPGIKAEMNEEVVIKFK